jgi:hypothetical protein
MGLIGTVLLRRSNSKMALTSDFLRQVATMIETDGIIVYAINGNGLGNPILFAREDFSKVTDYYTIKQKWSLVQKGIDN